MYNSITRFVATTVLFVSVAHTAVPLRSDAAPRSLQIKEVWATKGALDSPFVAIEGMGELKDGTILVADPRANRVYGLSEDGSDVRVVAPAGDGPGEVRLPHLIASLPDGGAAIYDMGHNALEIFNEDGTFRHRAPMERLISNPKGFVALSNRQFAVSGGIYGEVEAVHIVGFNGRREHAWLSLPRTSNLRASVLTAGGPLALDGKGNLVVSRASPHEILVFSLDGEPLKTIASDPDLLDPIGDDFIRERGFGASMVRSFDWFFPQSKGLFQLSGGELLNVIRLYEEGQSIWEIYRTDGKLVARTRVPRAYAPWGMTQEGRILASYIDPRTEEHVAVALELSFD